MAHSIKSALTKNSWSHYTFLSIIIVLTFLAYSNVLHGEPIFDDIVYTFSDPLFQSPHAFKDMDLWEAFKGGMRPVTSFTFSLNYYFFGKDTFSYHLTNLFIHIINGVLVYVFVYITLTLPAKPPNAPALRLPLFGKEGIRGELVLNEVRGDFTTEQWTAFLTALLFSLHPIQTESVSYIYQRAESLSSLFYLASLISFILAARQSEGRFLRSILYTLFIFGFVLALGSKEIAITLPATAFLYGIFFFEKKGLWKKLSIPSLLILAGLIVAAVRLIILRENPSAGYHLKEFTAWEYLLTQFSAITNYLRLLLLPVGQNIDHGYQASRSILETRTIASVAFLSSLLLVASIFYRRWRAGSFFILWFFLLLLPSSSILPLSDAFVEHRLYLPSVGIFFIFSSGIVKTVELERARAGRILSGAVLSILLIIFILGVAAYSRNRLWNSTVAMWQDVVGKSPGKARAHYNLGAAYGNKDMMDGAIEQYQTALRLRPDYIEAHYNLGRAYSIKGLLDRAIEEYLVALRLKPDFIGAYNNLGDAYSEKGWIDKAIEEHRMAVRLGPGDIKANNNLGIDYFKKGMLGNAIWQFEAVLRLKPDHLEAQNNLGNCYFAMGDYKKALKEYLKALRVNQKYFDAYYNVGLSLSKVGASDIASEFFVVFVRYGPDKYANEKRELAQKYNITKDTTLPDIDLLIDRATKALNPKKSS